MDSKTWSSDSCHLFLTEEGKVYLFRSFFFNVLQRFLKCFFFLQARHWIFMAEHLGALANDLGGHSCDRFHQQQGTLRDHVGSDKTGRKCMGPESAVMRPFSFVVNSAGMQRR